MSSVSRILFVSTLFCAHSVIACGGSTDAHGNPTSDESAGAPAAGHGNSAGAGAGGSAGAGQKPTPTPSGTTLSEIKTDAQALTVCNRIKDSFSEADLKKMVQGSCAIQGLTGAASELGSCEELQADCAKQTPLPATDDGSCTAEDIPDCDDVTVDEYVACTQATMQIGIDYLSSITCDSDLQSLKAPPRASACKEPFARCPEYAALFE